MKHLISLFFRRNTSRALLLLTILALTLVLQICGPWGVHAMETEGKAKTERAIGRTLTNLPTTADAGRREEDNDPNDPRDATPILTVNLAWVCGKPTPQKYIYPAPTEDELKS